MDKNNFDASANKDLGLLYYNLYLGCITHNYINKNKKIEEINCDKYYKELEKIADEYYKVTK